MAGRGSELVDVRVRGHVVVPYEWIGSPAWRLFSVPAVVVNRCTRQLTARREAGLAYPDPAGERRHAPFTRTAREVSLSSCPLVSPQERTKKARAKRQVVDRAGIRSASDKTQP